MHPDVPVQFSFWVGMIYHGLIMCDQDTTTDTTDNIYWHKRYKVDDVSHLFNTSQWPVHHAVRIIPK